MSIERRREPCDYCLHGVNTGRDHPECCWDQRGHSGPHEDHFLSCDPMGDVWCGSCAAWLEEDELQEAWPS